MRLTGQSVKWLVWMVLAMLVVSCGKTEKKRRTVGYKGEARANAFLAAQRLLTQRGYDVESRYGMGELDYTTSTLLLSPASLNTAGRGKRVMEWVQNGGHLVVMISGGTKRGNDFRLMDDWWSYMDDGTAGLTYLLDELGVEMVDWKRSNPSGKASDMTRDEWESLSEEERVLLLSEKQNYDLGGDRMEIYHWSDKGLIYPVTFEGEYGTAEPDEDKHRFLSLYHGVGRVTLLTDASSLRNRFVGQGDHARFVCEIMEMSRQGTIVFADGGGDSFLGMLWRFFKMALIGLAVTIIFWLWKNLPRFGPRQDLPDSDIREFSGQVRGVGRFFWRHKRDDTMLHSLRRTVNRRLSTGPDGMHEGIFEQLSESTGLPVESVIEAMTREQVREPGAMVRIVKNLQIILKQIN